MTLEFSGSGLLKLPMTTLTQQAFRYYAMVRFRTVCLKLHPITSDGTIHEKRHNS